MRNKERRMPANRFRAHTLRALFFALLFAATGSGIFPQVARGQDDPFAQPPKSGATPPLANAPGSQAAKNPTDDRIDFAVTVSPKEAKRGETVKLTITGTPRPGFHTYPLTQRADN